MQIKKNIQAFLMALLNIIYIPGMIISEAGLLFLFLGALPVEYTGTKVFNRIAKKVGKRNEMKIFHAGEEMINASKKKEEIRRAIYRLEKQLENEISKEEKFFSNDENLLEISNDYEEPTLDSKRKSL